MLRNQYVASLVSLEKRHLTRADWMNSSSSRPRSNSDHLRKLTNGFYDESEHPVGKESASSVCSQHVLVACPATHSRLACTRYLTLTIISLSACYILPCLIKPSYQTNRRSTSPQTLLSYTTPPPFPFSFSQPTQKSDSIYHHCSTKRDLFILFSLSESKEYHCLLAVCRTRSFASLIKSTVVGFSVLASQLFPQTPLSPGNEVHQFATVRWDSTS